MDSFSKLSGQLMGLWLVIVGIAIAFGVLFAVGNSLRHWKRLCSANIRSETN